MEKSLRSLILLAILFITKSNAQDKRTILFSNLQVDYIVHKNFITLTSNTNANFIIYDEEVNLEVEFENDNIKNVPIEFETDYGFYYYIKLPKLQTTDFIKFIYQFIDETAKSDSYNLNRTHLFFKSSEITFNCGQLSDLNEKIASIWLEKNHPNHRCEHYFIADIGNFEHLTAKKRNSKTIYKHEATDLKKVQESKDELELLKDLNDWKKNFFVSFTVGRQQIAKSNQTNFDSETLIDFSELNTIWSLNSGYMFTNRFGLLLNFGFIYKKEESNKSFERTFDGVTISGTGNGAGVVKLGIGATYFPFIKDRWSIFTDVVIGNLNAKAGGGSGEVSIIYNSVYSTSEIIEKNEKTTYLDLNVGANYRLGRVAFLKSSFQYSFSKFDNAIGSVNGFTGYTIHLGIGVTFK